MPRVDLTGGKILGYKLRISEPLRRRIERIAKKNKVSANRWMVEQLEKAVVEGSNEQQLATLLTKFAATAAAMEANNAALMRQLEANQEARAAQVLAITEARAAHVLAINKAMQALSVLNKLSIDDAEVQAAREQLNAVIVEIGALPAPAPSQPEPALTE
jgi:hypothetical protein